MKERGGENKRGREGESCVSLWGYQVPKISTKYNCELQVFQLNCSKCKSQFSSSEPPGRKMEGEKVLFKAAISVIMTVVVRVIIRGQRQRADGAKVKLVRMEANVNKGFLGEDCHREIH